MRLTKTKKEFNQEIINDYFREHGVLPVRMREIAEWAIRTKRWEPQRGDLIGRCAVELSESAREEFYTDPQGRNVRKKHVICIDDDDGKQLFLWADIGDATPDHMRLSFSQRRRGILGDCKQLKADQDSYNDNNKLGAHLEQLDFNFNADLEEMDQPTDYPDAPPDED